MAITTGRGPVKLVDRPLYMDKLEVLIDAPVVKVLTGLRRSGKSKLLDLVAERLRDRGVAAERILHLNFDSLELVRFASAEALNSLIKERVPAQGPVYILLDEIQEVRDWEKLVNSLISLERFDIYITGSNSRLLSGELSTYIAGRYIAIDVWPLSFSEYLVFGGTYSDRDVSLTNREFERFVRLGGFPGIHSAPLDEQTSLQMVSDIYRSTLVRDVLTRNSIRDADMFAKVAAYVVDNVGNPFSARRVAEFMKSQRRSVSHETVLNYLGALAEAFVITRVPRYDVRGRALLATDEKHYLGDHGVASALFGSSQQRLPGVLENIVWMELRRRGYQVFVGRVGKAEVDFVATRQSDVVYVQVSVTVAASETTRAREYAPLEAIPDNYPKFVVTLDPAPEDNAGGIRQMKISDFLLSQDY